MALGSSSVSSAVERGLQYNGEGYAPGHITGFFTIHMTNDPISSGSTGAGLCLKEGVITEVTVVESDETELAIELNGVPAPSSPTCDSVLIKLLCGRPMRVTASQTSNLPAGYGYAVSGASALSLAIAVNQALDLSLTKSEAGRAAHVAEIENLTGLGDVSAQLLGGLVVRQRPGAPGFGEARCLPSPNDHVVITSPVTQFPTSRMITEEQYVKKINALGESSMSFFMPSPDINNFMRQSRTFWQGVGIANDRVQQTIKLFESAGVPSPSAKKGVVFGLVPRDDLKRVLSRLAPRFKLKGDPPPVIRDSSCGLTIIISEISTRGAC
jgi:pantoate kinase